LAGDEEIPSFEKPPPEPAPDYLEWQKPIDGRELAQINPYHDSLTENLNVQPPVIRETKLTPRRVKSSTG